MLALDIMSRVLQQDMRKRTSGLPQRQQTEAEAAMGSFSIEMGKPANGYLPIKIEGALPSATSSALKQLSSIGLGYTLGNAIYAKGGAAELGKKSTILETGIISSTASISSLLLEYYLFSKYFGIQLPQATIEFPVKMPNESEEDYRRRGRSWVELQKKSGGLGGSLKELAEGLSGTVKAEALIWTATALASGYHGYKRHGGSIGMMLGWALFGNTGVALAQGYAKPLVNPSLTARAR